MLEQELTTIRASSDPLIAVRKLTCRSVGWGVTRRRSTLRRGKQAKASSRSTHNCGATSA